MPELFIAYVLWNEAEQAWYREPDGRESAWTRVPDLATRFPYANALQLKASFPRAVQRTLVIRRETSMPTYNGSERANGNPT